MYVHTYVCTLDSHGVRRDLLGLQEDLEGSIAPTLPCEAERRLLILV